MPEEEKKEPQMLADSFGAGLIDYVPLMPTTARRAGAAHLMSERMGEDPSFLVKNPLASQLIPLSLTAGGALTGNRPAALLGLASLAAMQYARRREMLNIQERYKGHKKKKRLDSAGVRDLVQEDHPISKFGFGGSKRLGLVQAQESMKARRYKGLPASSEVGDILTASSFGAYNPIAQFVDDINAKRLRNNDDKDRWQDVEGDEISANDQRKGTVLPYYLAAAGTGSIVGSLAHPLMLSDLLKGDRLDRHKWRGLANEVLQSRNTPFLMKSPSPYDGFYLGDGGFGGGARDTLREHYASAAASGADPQIFEEHPDLLLSASPELKRLAKTGRYSSAGARAKLTDDIALKMKRDGLISIGDTMSMAPVVAHEAGHAKIDRSPGVVKFLQDYLYPLRPFTAPLASAGSFGAGMLTKSPWLGALAGGLTGSAIHSGTIVPEFMASVHGLEGLQKYDGGKHYNSNNAKALRAALSTYLATTTLPSVFAGAAGGLLTKLREKERDKKKKDNKK
jgi:hypothetical protein